MFDWFVIASLLIALPFSSSGPQAGLGMENIVGRWRASLDGPGSPRQVELEFTLAAGGELHSALVKDTPVAAEHLRFEDPYLTTQIAVDGESILLKGVVKKGKLTGRWEKPGTDSSGYWSAERVTENGSGLAEISGPWNLTIYIPNNDQKLVLTLRSDGTKLIGNVGLSLGGGVPIKGGSYEDGKLTFSVDFLGNTYRFEGKLERDGSLSGRWFASGAFEGRRIPTMPSERTPLRLP